MDKTRNDNKDTQELLDAILGPDEDLLGNEHCEEFLLASGIDPTTLLSDFKEHLEEKARQYQSSTGSLPNSITGALRVIRERLKSSNLMTVDPTSHIDLLVSGGLVSGNQATSFARAFRRESDDELCDADQELLDDLEAELANENPKPTNESNTK